MPSDEVKTGQALLDILANIDNATAFVSDMSEADFLKDAKTYYAALRALEIISEASRKFPEDLLLRHPHIPWKNIRDAGNIYRHDYLKVAANTVWATINDSLPPLREVAVKELVDMGFGDMVLKRD